jgi:hypothetical protein
MPHLVACRTRGDHRDVDRAAAGVAEDVLSNHRSPNARRRSPNAHRPSAILDVPPRVGVTRQRVMRAGHRRGAAPLARDPCAPSMRSVRGRPA